MSSKEKLKILFLASWYPSRVHTQRGIFVQRHAEAVARTCRVAVLSLFPDPNLEDNHHEIECRDDGNLLTVRIFYKTRQLPVPGVARLYKLLRYCRFHRTGFNIIINKIGVPDLVHVHVIYLIGWFALWLKWFKHIPYIVSEHSSSYLQKGKRLQIFPRQWLARLVVKNARHVTTVSRSLMQAMEQKGLASQYTVIPNVVDTRNFFYDPVIKRRGKKRMLHVSLLSDEKNMEGILQTIAHLGARRQDFELHIAGDGPNRPRLEVLASELRIKDQLVFFLGLQDSAPLAQLMRDSDFLVIFSHFESLPCVLIEAMASGLPVIATRVGGIPDHLGPGMGLLVEPANEADLLAAMEYMLDHSGEYSSSHIQEYARSHFDFDVVGRQFLEIYSREIAGKETIQS
jgi:glycosyltransferase involved in cell wall biosynthesis